MSALFGVVGVFAGPDAVRAAATRLRDAGYRTFEAYTPYPVEGVRAITDLGPHKSLPLLMALFAVAAGLSGFLAASPLPQLYHPLFEASRFARASRDRFLICVEATDPHFDADTITELLRELGAGHVERVLA